MRRKSKGSQSLAKHFLENSDPWLRLENTCNTVWSWYRRARSTIVWRCNSCAKSVLLPDGRCNYGTKARLASC